MTVTNTSSKITYSGNGVTTEFPIPFRFLDPSHIRVVLTSNEIDADTTNFTVSGSNLIYPANGAILASGRKLTIMRRMEITQETQLENQGAYHPAVVEAALDERAMIEQQLQEQLDRTIRLPPSYAGGDTSDSNLALEVLGARDRAEAAAGQAEGAAERAEEEAERAERAAERADGAVAVAAEAAAGLMEDAVIRVETVAEDAVGRVEEASGEAVERAETAADNATDQAKTAAEQAQYYAEQLTGLSVAVSAAPTGDVASGSYNAETGVLTLHIPGGSVSGQPPISDSIDSPDSGIYASSKAVYDAARAGRTPQAHTHDVNDLAGVLPIASGGTGNATGRAATATKLASARTIHTDLGSTAAAPFDGSRDIVPGVSGILPIELGGTGNSSGTAMFAHRANFAVNAADADWAERLSHTLEISEGGTGAASAEQARTNLGITDAINALPLTRVWVSHPYELSTTHNYIVASHNLGLTSPERVLAFWWFQCVEPDIGFAAGALARVTSWCMTTSSAAVSTFPVVDTNTISACFYNRFCLSGKTDPNIVAWLTSSRWRLIFVIHY